MSRGCSAASRRFSAAYSAAVSGSARSASRNARCLRSHSLPTSQTWTCTRQRIAVVVAPAQELVFGLDRIDAVSIPGGDERIDDRGSRDRGRHRHLDVDHRFRGQAGHGRRAHVLDADREVAEQLAETSGLLGEPRGPCRRRSRPGRTRGSVPGSLRASPATRATSRRGRTRRRSPAVPGPPRRCPPDATGRRASRRPRRGRPRRARSPRPSRRRSNRSRPGRRRRDRRPDGGATSTRGRRPRRGQQPAPGRRLHVVRRDRIGDRDAVLQQPRDVGEVLVQRAAERDVHHLHPATDRERREPEAVRGEQQVDLELVAVGLDAVGVLDGRHRRRSAAGRRRRRPPTAARRTVPGSPRGRSSRRGSRSGRARRIAGAHRCTGRGRRSRHRAIA